MTPRLARRGRAVIVGLVTVAALGLTACSGGNPLTSGGDANTIDESLAGSIDGAIENAMQLSGSTEAVVGVWDGGEGEYVRGYGNEEVDGDTRIRAGQTTQPVMCALLLDLAEQGRVELDAEVAKDLTRQSGIDGITYRQLCEQRSGLGDFTGNFTDVFTNNPTRPWPEQELLAQGLANSPQSWPGLDFHQADTNAVLLSRALKVRMGEDVDQLLKDHVFEQAGMGSSSYTLGATTVSGTTLSGLTFPSAGGEAQCEAGAVEVPEVSPTMLGGAGATVSTVTDIKNFYEKYSDGAFGGEKLSKTVTEAQPTKNPKRDENGEPTEDPDTEGRQWAFGMEKEGPLYGSNGRITGTLSAAYHDPESGYSVVVALNNSSAGRGFVKQLALQLAAISSEAGSGPELSWTAESKAEEVGKAAICQ